MSSITQSRGLRATVWLASTYICFLVASTAPWQQPSADHAPSVTGGLSLTAPAAPSVSGAGIRAGLGDVAPFAPDVPPFSPEEVRTAASAKPYVGSAVEADRSVPGVERGSSARVVFKGIQTRARIDVSREVLADFERVAPVVATAAADLAIRHVAAAVRSIDIVRVKKAIAGAECAETKAAAKVVVAEVAAEAIEHLVVRGVEAAVAHGVKVRMPVRTTRHGTSF